MISTNYKKNKLLREFIIDKLITSEEPNKKHDLYIKINKLISTLSIINVCGIVAYPFINIFFFHSYSFTSYLLPPVISTIFGGGLATINNIILEKHNSLQIEYTHDDFIKLSQILTEEEMNKFAEEIEKSNCLHSWVQYIKDTEEKYKIDNIKMKKESRKNYISSLYKGVESK